MKGKHIVIIIIAILFLVLMVFVIGPLVAYKIGGNAVNDQFNSMAAKINSI